MSWLRWPGWGQPRPAPGTDAPVEPAARPLPEPRRPPRADVQERLLLAAVQDLQGSVRAGDAKNSAALILHGLLFAGVLTISQKLGGTFYNRAPTGLRDGAWAALAVALIAFVVSVGSLLKALMPHRPDEAFRRRLETADPPPARVFFPDLARFRPNAMAPNDLDSYMATLVGLDESTVTRELAFELLKLQDILTSDRAWARAGFRALAVELVAVGAFLALVAARVLSA